MSKILPLRQAGEDSLKSRKAQLLQQIEISPGLLHASLVKRFLTCGKKTCRCRRGGLKHGPFFYLVRSFGRTTHQSQLLKTKRQIEAARKGIKTFAALKKALDELSQINFEFLRRNLD